MHDQDNMFPFMTNCDSTSPWLFRPDWLNKKPDQK